MMMRLTIGCVLAGFVVAMWGQAATAEEEKVRPPEDRSGGLVVLLGCDELPLAKRLAGQHLVHIIDRDAAKIQAAQKELHEAGLYGLVSAEVVASYERLPYTEDIVNQLFIGPAAGNLEKKEALRVTCPGGRIYRWMQGLSAGYRGYLPTEKPWPAEMDTWSHPRHGANNNPVSKDLAVGPARRVRWVTGPQQEISNMVTAGGRNYYAGVLVRDSFNGLKLWDTALKPSPARGGFGAPFVSNAMLPVATSHGLYVINDGKLLALNGVDGKIVREYKSAGVPTTLLVVDGATGARNAGSLLIAIDKAGITAVNAVEDKALWKFVAVEPRFVVADTKGVYFVHGASNAAEPQLVALDDNGKPKWQAGDPPWLPKVRNLVCRGDLLVCEVSTLSDDKPGNAIHVLDAATGKELWNREFIPGMTHKKQARAMFAGELLWTLEVNSCCGLDPRTGEQRYKYPAGNGHCFPPVATDRYLFAGELDMTDLQSGKVDANRITKGACSRDAGWIPANGLIYTAPKHCICWPMLRDYSALAPERSEGPATADITPAKFVPELGTATPWTDAPALTDADWPVYRHDVWRSASTAADVSEKLAVRWTTKLGDRPQGAVADDWRGNYFVRGPVGPPVVAYGRVYVTRPDMHEVVALDAASGKPAWRFTANGRVDTAPTIHDGRCMFGCKSGWVYCLNAKTGELLWRLRAAPVDERIVAYGQLESPWPVPGSVLVADGVAYFAAGRQSLADGGILVFAVNPADGKPLWVQRLGSVPQTKFYDSSGLEFDNFDLLHREGDRIAMSRWYFDMKDGSMTLEAKSGFAKVGTVGGSVMVPRGTWSYAPRNETEHWKERPYVRPLSVFRGNALFTCSQDRKTVFRRDFALGNGEKFDADWFKGWETYARARKGGELWQSQRLAANPQWTATPGDAPIAGMVLTPERLFVATSAGKLAAVSTADGRVLATLGVPAVTWDSLAAGGGQLFLSTPSGDVVCVGQP